MAFTAILKWCLSHWRWFAYAALALAAWWSVAVVLDWRSDSKALPLVKEEVLQERKKREEEILGIRKELDEQIAASKGYQDELTQIRDMPVPGNTVIRVCRPASLPRTNQGTVASGPSPAPTTDGVLPEPLELDTRPLYDDAKRADGLSAQVRGLLELCR